MADDKYLSLARRLIEDTESVRPLKFAQALRHTHLQGERLDALAWDTLITLGVFLQQDLENLFKHLRRFETLTARLSSLFGPLRDLARTNDANSLRTFR